MFFARKQLLHQTQQVFLADPQILAGEEGETLTAECIRRSLKHRQGEARLYPSLRVPRQDGLGKSEIDFVLLSPQGLWVIEVKHWSGRVRRSGQQWIQESSPCKKAVEDPWHSTHRKSADLIHWLQKRGCSLAPAAVKTLVILTHPEVELLGDLVHEPNVLRLAGLPAYLKSQILHAAPRPLPFDFAALKGQIKQLPTWDIIALHGGRVWRGDLHGLYLQRAQGTLTLSRQHFAEAAIHCPRQLWQTFFRSPRAILTNWQGRQQSYSFEGGSHLLFQPAGQAQREQLSLLHVEAISLGSRDQGYYQSKAPFLAKKP